jgi:glycosyltransferase involved in cell wall biosynthesis
LNPLLTIIIPYYNKRDTILRAVKSVLNQTYIKSELIIIDDCGKVRIQEKIIHQDERIRVLFSEANKGAALTMQRGLENSKGEKKLFTQTPQLDFLYFLSKTIKHQSVFIKTELAKKYRFDTSYSIVADWIMLFRILKLENPQIRYVNLPLCIYDTTGISSVNFQEQELHREKFMKSIYSDWELSQLMVLAGMRRKKWFLWFYNSFQRELINFWMRCSSQVFKVYGKK